MKIPGVMLPDILVTQLPFKKILFVSLIFSSRTVPLDMCQVQFLSTNKEATNQVVTVVTSLAAFYLPVTLMAILYFKIFLETRQRHKELRKLQASGW